MSDAIPISQSWETFEGKFDDEGAGVARLYAADHQVKSSNAVLWLLEKLTVADAHCMRSLRSDVPIIHFGWGKNGWDQAFARLATTEWVCAPHTLHPLSDTHTPYSCSLSLSPPLRRLLPFSLGACA